MSVPAKNRFLDTIAPPPQSEVPSSGNEGEQPKTNRFLQTIETGNAPKQESLGKNLLRKIYQPVSGFLKAAYTWPLELLNAAASAESIQDIEELKERIPELKKKFPNAPWDQFNEEEFFNPERIQEAVETAQKYSPTSLTGIENILEDTTGAPLTPKSRTDRLLGLAGAAGRVTPGTAGQKVTGAVAAPVTSELLKRHGYPEEAADAIGLGLSQQVPTAQVAKNIKPSGTPARKFEKLEKPTRVSETRFGKINETIESDFRTSADKILEENRTYSATKQEPKFRQKIEKIFDDVHEASKQITQEIPNEAIRKSMRREFDDIEKKGFMPSEYEKSLRKDFRQLMKDTPFENVTATQIVDQYRKNNKSLGQYFEPGKSGASNNAKRDALLIQQRAIADVIEKQFPNSEFSKNFKFSNKRWQELSDIDTIENYLTKVFPEDQTKRISFKQAKKFHDDPYTQKAFKRLLKPDDYKKFNSLMNEFTDMEKAYAYIKKANSAGFKEIGEKAALYMLSPKAATAKVGIDAYKTFRRMLLDKPDLIYTWESGLKNFKKGNYKEAGAAFDILTRELNSPEKRSQSK